MTVVLDKPDYVEKVKQLLNDTSTYRRIETDPTEKLTKEIEATLKKLENLKEITRDERWRMRPNGATIASILRTTESTQSGNPVETYRFSTRDPDVQFGKILMETSASPDSKLTTFDQQPQAVPGQVEEHQSG